VLLSVIPLIWLIAIAYVVAICRLAGHSGHNPVPTRPVRDGRVARHAVGESTVGPSVARPGCELRQHGPRVGASSSSPHRRIRAQRAPHGRTA
jgi:hypothetical protein